MTLDGFQLVIGFAQHAVFSAALLVLALGAMFTATFANTVDAIPDARSDAFSVPAQQKVAVRLNATRARRASVVLGVLIGLAGAWWTRGWLGELSMPNTAWSCGVLVWASEGANPKTHVHKRWFKVPVRAAAFVALGGAVLYAHALALLPFDAYSLGYDAPLAALAVAASVGLFWRGVVDWAWLVLASTAVWAFGLGHSVNAWDTLLDAPFWAVCCTIAVRAAWHPAGSTGANP